MYVTASKGVTEVLSASKSFLPATTRAYVYVGRFGLLQCMIRVIIETWKYLQQAYYCLNTQSVC